MLKKEGHKDKEIKHLRAKVEYANARYDDLCAEKDCRLDEARKEVRRERRHFLFFVPLAFVAGGLTVLQALPLQ